MRSRKHQNIDDGGVKNPFKCEIEKNKSSTTLCTTTLTTVIIVVLVAMAKAQVASVTSYRNPKLISIPDVEIDKSGKFKYILIKVHDPEIDREFKHIVRGSSKNGYIDDLVNNVFQMMDDKNLDCEVVGGGFLDHEPAKKSIKIYGRSPKYGQADHSVTQALLLLKFKDYDQITYNNDKM